MSLPEPRTPAGRAGVTRALADPGRVLLAMDFDGTLAPIVPRPEDARALPQVRPVLGRLAPRVGRVAIVTGRPALQAVAHSGLAGLGRLVVLGHYGLERWEDGSVQSPDPAPGLAQARRRLADVLGDAGAPVGTTIEEKGHALAVHVRRTPDPAAAIDVLADAVAALAAEAGLVVEPGRMVLELRPPGMDKGRALRALVDEGGGLAGWSAVVFVGDDLGDLAAFAEVERARLRGLPGLLICSGSGEATTVADRADLVVAGPAGVVAWLEALADEIGA